MRFTALWFIIFGYLNLALNQDNEEIEYVNLLTEQSFNDSTENFDNLSQQSNVAFTIIMK